MEENKIITNNSDFLFIYEAINCNPNGDPDQENKPRMDYDTQTNLVTDVRIKRFIRDYLKNNGLEIFVDMEGESKVSPDTHLKNIINEKLSDDKKVEEFFKDNQQMQINFKDVVKSGEKDIAKKLKDNKNANLNYFILEKLVHENFIDIRMFGSAFAVEGFTRSYTGPIQLNWGYSLNKVEMIDSNSIVTIMNDDNSTFGKDYRVYYSLLAFNGTINKYTAKSTHLKQKDVQKFREAIWNSISAVPTRSKLNQYPKLYVELIYDDNYFNGYFGDLRHYIKVKSKNGITDKQVRKYNDLEVDFSQLKELIENNKGDNKPIKNVIVKKSADVDFPDKF